jgi:hypothetical protein
MLLLLQAVYMIKAIRLSGWALDSLRWLAWSTLNGDTWDGQGIRGD